MGAAAIEAGPIALLVNRVLRPDRKQQQLPLSPVPKLVLEVALVRAAMAKWFASKTVTWYSLEIVTPSPEAEINVS